MQLKMISELEIDLRKQAKRKKETGRQIYRSCKRLQDAVFVQVSQGMDFKEKVSFGRFIG